jgi:hypothetical protein
MKYAETRPYSDPEKAAHKLNTRVRFPSPAPMFSIGYAAYGRAFWLRAIAGLMLFFPCKGALATT